MDELKPCPFCGGKANLKRYSSFYRNNPSTTIKDEWGVECENNCCKTNRYRDDIYHADSGDVIIANNGAHEAIEAWNRRVSGV